MKKIITRSLLALLIIVGGMSLCSGVQAKEGEKIYTGELQLIKDGFYPQQDNRLVSQMSVTNEKGLKDALTGMMDAVETVLDISQYQVSVVEFKNIMQGIVDSNPQYFYLNKNYHYSLEGSYVKQVTLSYLFGKDTIVQMRNQVAAAVGEILEGINPQMTELEKALFVHDKLVLWTSYDRSVTTSSTNSDGFNMYGILVKKTGVCQGYAAAYMYILNTYLNMSCEMVTSEAMVHAWNIVRIGGSYYHVDVTGDDTVPDCIGLVDHSHFLCSDTYMANNQYYSYASPYKANDTHYDTAFWKAYVSSFEYVNGKDWYTINSGEIQNIYTATSTNNYTDLLIRTKYTATGGLDMGYGLSTLAADGDTLYYNTANYICSMKADGTEHKRLYEYTGREVIFGIAFVNNVLHAEVRYDLQNDGTDITVAEIVKQNARNTFYVTFETSSNDTKDTAVAVANGGVVVPPTNPVKSGYTFNGWFLGLNGTGAAWNPTTPITSDLVVYASWLSGEGAMSSINVEPSLKVTAGKRQKLQVGFTPANPFNKAVTYTSSNTKVATVNRSGSVKGVKVGRCTITIAAADNPAINAKVKVTVVPKNVTKFKVTAGKKKATIRWKSAKGTTGVVIYRSTSKSGKYKKIATLKKKKTSYVNKGLLKKGIYFYKIVTYQKSGGKKYTSLESKIIKIKAK